VRAAQKKVDFSEYRYLRIEITDGIAEVTIKRPDYDARGHWEICEIFRDLDLDTSVRAVLLSWANPPEEYDSKFDVFPAADLDPGERFALYTQGFREAREGVYNVINSVKPIVSVLSGVVPSGAALAAALLADVSVAGNGATIADTHVSMGIPAGDHACLWPVLIGLGRAKRLLLASEPISGSEAERIGLVSLAVPDDEVFDTARRYARKLADQPRNALRFTKRALNQYLKQAAIISFDLSMSMEQLGLLDGDLDTIASSGAGPANLGEDSTGSGAGEIRLPSAVFGDRSYAE
jgi:enoyl-CoA hydratase